MIFRKQVPDEPGWYWIKEKHREPSLVLIYDNCDVETWDVLWGDRVHTPDTVEMQTDELDHDDLEARIRKLEDRLCVVERKLRPLGNKFDHLVTRVEDFNYEMTSRIKALENSKS
jgi:hypothetical protein